MSVTAIVDLAAWAEDDFSGLCARAGVTRNKSMQDRTGWDYFIEFPAPRAAVLPADLRPVGRSARVQVKSKAKGGPHVGLKLVNALRFAKEPMPCFLVLYLATDGTEPVRIFAKHFWTDEIEAALKRARKAHEEGRDDLNKLAVRYSFNAADEHTSDLIAWMAAVASEHPDYAAAKQCVVDTVGFVEGGIHGTLTLAEDDLDALIDHQIGLAETAPAIRVALKQRRFGIDVALPLPDAVADVAHMRPHPTPCRVRLRPTAGPDLWVDGDLLVPALPGLPIERVKMRIVADFLEVVMTGRFEGNVTLNLDPERQRGLASHRALVEVLRMAADAFDLTVMVGGGPIFSAKVKLDGVGQDKALEQFGQVITCLEAASAGVLPPDLTVSSREIDEAWNDIVDFNGMVRGTDFKGSFELDAAPSVKQLHPSVCFFFDSVTIGAWTFGAVVRRRVRLFEMDGAAGRLELEPARVVEALVRRGDAGAIGDDLRALYKRSYEPEKASALELFGGSYRGLLAMDVRRSHG